MDVGVGEGFEFRKLGASAGDFERESILVESLDGSGDMFKWFESGKDQEGGIGAGFGGVSICRYTWMQNSGFTTIIFPDAFLGGVGIGEEKIRTLGCELIPLAHFESLLLDKIFGDVSKVLFAQIFVAPVPQKSGGGVEIGNVNGVLGGDDAFDPGVGGGDEEVKTAHIQAFGCSGTKWEHEFSVFGSDEFGEFLEEGGVNGFVFEKVVCGLVITNESENGGVGENFCEVLQN